jgi:enoyl-CoA hydratase/carnithine racemase
MNAPVRPLEPALPHLAIEQRGALAIVRLDRPAKRNAVNDALIASLEKFFEAPPAEAKAVVLAGNGEHFCSGLDLSEHEHRDAFGVMQHSQMWHRVFEKIQFGALPVVAALHGGIIGGGLELAAATHVRVADRTAFYALPEARHGLFVGGGGSVRIPRLIGAHRMADMMLTGRVLDAEEGHALGLSHYLTGPGEGLDRALELTRRIASNPPVSNFAVLQALPRIAEADPADGYLLEALMAAVASSSDEAQQRMQAFLQGRAGKVQR